MIFTAVKTRKVGWVLVLVGGLLGWWVTLSMGGIFPRMGYWVENLAMIASAICFFKSMKVMGNDMDVWLDRWVRRHGYKPAHTLSLEKERVARWFFMPFAIWWLPTLFGMIAAFSGQMAF